jgi:putative FmdB family regulatory protein
MPLFDLNCPKCNKQQEVLCRHSAIPEQKCETCGGPLEQLPPTGTAFNLKGGGWYQSGFYAKKPSSKK